MRTKIPHITLFYHVLSLRLYCFFDLPCWCSNQPAERWTKRREGVEGMFPDSLSAAAPRKKWKWERKRLFLQKLSWKIWKGPSSMATGCLRWWFPAWYEKDTFLLGLRVFVGANFFQYVWSFLELLRTIFSFWYSGCCARTLWGGWQWRSCVTWRGCTKKPLVNEGICMDLCWGMYGRTFDVVHRDISPYTYKYE